MNALSRTKKWDFEPKKELRTGDHVTGSDVIGIVRESMMVTHSVMVPPNAHGTIKFVAPKGSYTVTVKII